MQYDLIVIGCGPAGQDAVMSASRLGKSVAVINPLSEADDGMTHFHSHVLAKALRHARFQLAGSRNDWAHQSTVGPTIRMQDVRDAVRGAVKRDSRTRIDQLNQHGVDILHGSPCFESPHRAKINSSTGTTYIEGHRVLLDVGTRPLQPQQVDIDGQTIFDTDNMFQMDHIPRSLAIIGAGVIGIEFGLLFTALGTQVTIVDGNKRLFPFWDRELTDSMLSHARSLGLKFQCGDEVIGVMGRNGNRPILLRESGINLVTDAVLFTDNHICATDGLNLSAAGLETDEHGRLWCNDQHQTWVDGIYAVGDVVGFPSVISTSAEQGKRAVAAAFGKPLTTESATFTLPTTPEMAMVGKTEQQLLAEGIPFEAGAARFHRGTDDNMHSQGTIRLLKLLFHRESHELLGIHCLGDSAIEVIQIGKTALACHGTINYFHETFFNYPTAAQCYKLAALDGLNKLPERKDSADQFKSGLVSTRESRSRNSVFA